MNSPVKVLLFAAIGCVLLSGESLRGQAVSTGSILADVFYGYPSRMLFIRDALLRDYVNDLEGYGLGPLGVRGEYLIAETFGLGLEVNYGRGELSYSHSTYTYRVTFRQIRVFPRFSFHLLKSSDKVDAYLAVGAGYNNSDFKMVTNDPYADDSFLWTDPVAFRLAVGFRAFPGKSTGFGMEIGAPGGGLLNAVLTFRFGSGSEDAGD